jgi:D-alanyl-D-alanine carboxypeptidase
LDGIQQKYAIPGVSVAITLPDGSTWLGTSGLAIVKGKVPVTPDTAFGVASISKTFVAALVMALVEEGSIRLETSAARYLPDLDLDQAITVRQLLDHTSGIRDFFFHRKIDAALLKDRDKEWDPATSLRYVGKRYFKPGKGWHYSNTNYLLLGMLAERVGGAPLATQLRTRFFDPLGLTHTTYQPTEVARGPMAHGYRFASTAATARPVDLSAGGEIVPFASVVTAAAGAGGIAASAIDLARWARALYAGSALDPLTVESMIADVALTRRFKPSRAYGLGLVAAPIDGRPTIGHSGRFLGSQAVMRWLPEEGVAIAVLTNQSRTDPEKIARALLKIALRPPDGCTCAGVY